MHHPASWKVYRYQYGVAGHVVGYLSTAEVRDPCSGNTCGARTVVGSLPPKGVLITFMTGGPTGMCFHCMSGTETSVDGLRAKVVIERGTKASSEPRCDERVTVHAVNRDSTLVLTIGACFNGPDLRQTEAKVLDVVRSVHLPDAKIIREGASVAG